MTRRPMLLAVCIIFLSYAFQIKSESQDQKNLSDEAKAYLERALDLMQQNALGRLSMNWDVVRKSALDHASGAEITVDTYDAIRLALRQINTHSFLQLSPELAAKEAARKKIKSAQLAKGKPSDALESEQRRQPSPFQTRAEPEGKLHKMGAHTIASVVTPMFVGGNGELFAAKLHQIISELEAAKLCGWIVDLRGNTGGNMWPMLVGVGPILGEGDVGAFKSDSGIIKKWRYKDGEASIIGSNGPEEVAAKITGTVYRLKNAPAVAVLIDRGTASSGEAIAVAFRGRNQTRSFGEHTMGFSTANKGFLLSDGANLVLTTGSYLDRKGVEYIHGLEPDEKTPSENGAGQSKKDLTIEAALHWLGRQRKCRD